MNLGAKIKQLRDEKDWTQGQLSAYSGLKRDYINAIENGRVQNPGADKIVQLAKALGVEEDILLEAAGIKRIDPNWPNGRFVLIPDELTEYDFRLVQGLVDYVVNIV